MFSVDRRMTGHVVSDRKEGLSPSGAPGIPSHYSIGWIVVRLSSGVWSCVTIVGGMFGGGKTDIRFAEPSGCWSLRPGSCGVPRYGEYGRNGSYVGERDASAVCQRETRG